MGLARNAFSLTSARVASKALAFGAAVLIARQLGAADFGQYNVILAFVLIFSFLGDLGMVSLLIREVAAKPGQTSALLSDGLVAQAGISAMIFVGLIAAGLAIESDPIVRTGVFIAGVALAIECSGRPFTAVLIGQGRLSLSAAVLAITSITNTVLLLLVLKLSPGVLTLVAASIPVAVVSAALPAALVIRSHVRLQWTVSYSRVGRLLWAAAPFAVLAGSTVLYDRVDVLMLSG